MPFTKHAVFTFISDKITKVTDCNVADLQAEFPTARDWVSGFALMVMFVDQPKEEMRPFGMQFVRRVEMALAKYSLARADLLGLVSGNRGRWSPYFRALYHFEAAIAQLYQAHDYSRKLLNTKLFASGDNSPLDRLNKIYGATKHQLAILDQPVWLTNEGIETAEAKISFFELEELMRSCARIATKLTTTS